jgi:hypothetical protein
MHINTIFVPTRPMYAARATRRALIRRSSAAVNACRLAALIACTAPVLAMTSAFPNRRGT